MAAPGAASDLAAAPGVGLHGNPTTFAVRPAGALEGAPYQEFQSRTSSVYVSAMRSTASSRGIEPSSQAAAASK